MKVLITGCSGYIGSSLTTRLLNLGHQVYGVDINLFSSDALNHLFLNEKILYFQSLTLEKNRN